MSLNIYVNKAKIHRKSIMCFRRVRFEIKLRKNEHGEIPR